MNDEPVLAWLNDWCATLPPGAVLERSAFRGQPTVTLDADQLLSVLTRLRDRDGFRYLADLTALDRRPQEPRFWVVYHLWNPTERRLLRVKAAAPGDPPTVASVTALWSTANWHERECYDLFGVHFRGHPDLRRILTPDGWQGHPLRKDYPTMGPPAVQHWVAPRFSPQGSAGGDGEGAAN